MQGDWMYKKLMLGAQEAGVSLGQFMVSSEYRQQVNAICSEYEAMMARVETKHRMWRKKIAAVANQLTLI